MSKRITITQQHFEVTESISEKKLLVKNGPVQIEIAIDKDHIEMTGQGDKEFVFMSSNSAKTVDRWESVLTTMLMAVRELKTKRKL